MVGRELELRACGARNLRRGEIERASGDETRQDNLMGATAAELHGNIGNILRVTQLANRALDFLSLALIVLAELNSFNGQPEAQFLV